MTNTKNKVCIIMSVYMGDKLLYLKYAVESVLQQSYVNLSFYIQCDGPVSPECEKYLDNILDKRVVVRKRKKNKGLAYSLNELLEIVINKNYEFIARFDADDICVKDRIKKQVSFMQRNIDVDVLGGYIEEFGENMAQTKVIKYPCDHDSMKNFFGKRNPLAHVSVLFKKSFFEKVGRYPENTDLDEDTMLWLEGFKKKCRFANLDEVLVKVRVSSDFFSRRNGFKKSVNDYKNRKKIIKILKLNPINHVWAFARLILLSIPLPYVTKLMYKVFR